MDRVDTRRMQTDVTALFALHCRLVTWKIPDTVNNLPHISSPGIKCPDENGTFAMQTKRRLIEPQLSFCKTMLSTRNRAFALGDHHRARSLFNYSTPHTMRHIVVLPCTARERSASETLQDFIHRYDIRYAECFVVTPAEGREKRGTAKQREGWLQTCSTPLCGSPVGRDVHIVQSDQYGETVVELIRRITNQATTVLHLLIAGEHERLSALAIGAVLLYGRPFDRLYWLDGCRSGVIEIGRIGVHNGPYSAALLQPPVSTMPLARHYRTHGANTNGVSFHGTQHLTLNGVYSAQTVAVLDSTHCTLQIGSLTVKLTPIECALYCWLIRTTKPISWGKSLSDDDWERFCECYRTICQHRRQYRVGKYSVSTPFDERLQVLQKAVSTIKRKISALSPSAAELYAPQPIGQYAEKVLQIRATIQLR